MWNTRYENQGEGLAKRYYIFTRLGVVVDLWFDGVSGGGIDILSHWSESGGGRLNPADGLAAGIGDGRDGGAGGGVDTGIGLVTCGARAGLLESSSSKACSSCRRELCAAYHISTSVDGSCGKIRTAFHLADGESNLDTSP